MNEKILDKYINKLTIDHIREYARRQNILLINNEDEIIYNYIKENYKKLYYENDKDLLNKLKCMLSFNTYEKLEKLYLEAK